MLTRRIKQVLGFLYRIWQSWVSFARNSTHSQSSESADPHRDASTFIRIDSALEDVRYAIREFRAEPCRDIFSVEGRPIFTSAIAVAMANDFPDKYVLRTAHPTILKLERELRTPFFASLWPLVMVAATELDKSTFTEYLVALCSGLENGCPPLRLMGFSRLVLREWAPMISLNLTALELKAEVEASPEVWQYIRRSIVTALGKDPNRMTSDQIDSVAGRLWKTN